MTTPATASITIRPAYADDQVALERLAVLDSAAAPPAAPMLIAEVDGEIRVALSLSDGSAIADPFVPTADILALVHKQAALLAGRPARRLRLRRHRSRLALQHA